MRTIGTSLALLLLLVAVTGPGRAAERLPLPEMPRPVGGLVYARPFVLAEAYTGYDEQPLFDRGYLVVLDVDPLLLEPRATSEPLVVAGDRLLHRVNIGASCGRLVGFVPGELDLARTAFWLDLADDDRLSGAVVGASRARAAGLGFAAPPSEQLRAALERGGEGLVLRGARELRARAGAILEQYCPDEEQLIRVLQGQPPIR